MSAAQPSFPPAQVSDAIRAGLPRRNDADVSPDDAAELSANYRNNLAHYQEHVRKSLADGDYLQAAEKSWGAYAQAIKIISADHGLHVNSHTAILRVSGRLIALVGPQNAPSAAALTNGLLVARAMHTHFYENDLPESAVVAGADTVANAINLWQDLFPVNGATLGDSNGASGHP